MFIWDNEKSRLVHYQSHTGFDLSSACKLFNLGDFNRIKIEKFDNEHYDILDKERIIKDDAEK